MEKTKNNKVIIIIIAAVAAVLLLAGGIFFLTKGKDAYRILKVFEVEGDALVTRLNTGDIVPYNNMVLESGDKICLNTGKMTLQADEDKYIYLEEQTEMVLEASGTGENSKTRINLTKGAITNDIQNPLSGESSYEINTPNSTMSVRGTTYRVAVYEEDGVVYTKVSVFDGEVASALCKNDGSISDEAAVAKGKEVIIYDDGTVTDYVSDPQDIDYSQLPQETIELLIRLADDGIDVGAEKEELEQYLDPGPFTVTFTYNGTVFGTQEVERGKTAVEPTLLPATSGSWNFDFTTPITKDTEIQWQ